MQKRLVILFFILQSFGLWAQDQHFTQYYAAPMFLNPAMTGNFDGRYRFSAIYRTQWASITDQPFRTSAAMFDLRMPLQEKAARQSFLGVGFDFYSDKLGSSAFSTSSLGIAGAYHKSLDIHNQNFITAAARLGFAQRSVNFEGLTFNDQFNGTNGYTLGTNEALPRNNVNYADLGAGDFWSTALDKSVQFHAGVAGYHLNRPIVVLYNSDSINNRRLPIRTSVVVGAKIPLSERIDLLPRAVVFWQGAHLEMNIGANARIGLNDYNDYSLFLGGWVRPVKDVKSGLGVDAAVIMTGFEFANYRLGLSYDATLSGLMRASRTYGAFEISFQFIGNYGEDKLSCPTF
jgi:type IX secretion system PorP/SprF family membrane protein